MMRNTLFVAALFAALVTLARAALGDDDPSVQWRSMGDRSAVDSSNRSDASRTARKSPSIAFPSGEPSPRRSSIDEPAGVRLAGANLPADGGQVWREYDISSYAMRVSSTERPEQALVDWILRETGYEAWHGETVSILSASPRKIRVYHTPEIQAVVAEIVDRFVGDYSSAPAADVDAGERGAFGFRLDDADGLAVGVEEVIRLVAAGKPKIVALVATMRKLLTILNAMIRDQKPWQTA